MGLRQQQVQIGIDFELREVTLGVRNHLDINPTVVKLPIAVIKALAHTILKAEAEDELTALTGMAEATGVATEIVKG